VDSKGYLNLSESFLTFSKTEIGTIIKDLDQMNLNSRFGIF
jgi:hypothetical protein